MDETVMKVGITGSSGFVGHHLREALTAIPGVEVEGLEKGKHDLFRVESLRSFVCDKEVIYHLANLNRDTKENLLKVNVLGTLNLMEALAAYAPPLVTVIYLSSFQVYETPRTPIAIDEHWPIRPRNIYGISKMAAEAVIKSFPLRGIIFRGSNFFGPRCKPYYNSVIATFCDLLRQGKPLTVHGSGDQGRDFLYISDAVAVLCSALSYRPHGVEIYNLCSGALVTINSIIEMLSVISKRKHAVINQDAPGESVLSWWGDNSACRETFNWVPRITMEEGLQHTYAWWEREGDERP